MILKKLKDQIKKLRIADSHPAMGGMDTMYSIPEKFKPLVEFLKIPIDLYIPSTSEISGANADNQEFSVSESSIRNLIDSLNREDRSLKLDANDFEKLKDQIKKLRIADFILPVVGI